MVADYIFEKDKLFACLNLNDQELDTYNRYFNYLSRTAADARPRHLSAGHARSAEEAAEEKERHRREIASAKTI